MSSLVIKCHRPCQNCLHIFLKHFIFLPFNLYNHQSPFPAVKPSPLRFLHAQGIYLLLFFIAAFSEKGLCNFLSVFNGEKEVYSDKYPFWAPNVSVKAFNFGRLCVCFFHLRSAAHACFKEASQVHMITLKILCTSSLAIFTS